MGVIVGQEIVKKRKLFCAFEKGVISYNKYASLWKKTIKTTCFIYYLSKTWTYNRRYQRRFDSIRNWSKKKFFLFDIKCSFFVIYKFNTSLSKT